MSATKAAPTEETPAARDEFAQMLKTELTFEPVAERELARRFSVDKNKVTAALQVLEARHEARRVKYPKGGSPQGGWALYDSPHISPAVSAEEMNFPYDFGVVTLEEMFVDADYQRPLTTFAAKIERQFNPVLFQTLVLSDRGTAHRPRRYAIIDGQTRWHAARRRGIQSAPAIVFHDLTPANEAQIFWQLQKERRSVVSYHRFRAQLASGDPESQAIYEMVAAAGYEMGEGTSQVKSVAALETCFRQDEFTLERTLADLKEAWPDIAPAAKFIRGLHYFFRHYPIGDTANKEVDDEKLVRRLKAAGPDGLNKKALAAKEIASGSSTQTKAVAMAIQSAYLSR